jgi:hypothetical protein
MIIIIVAIIQLSLLLLLLSSSLLLLLLVILAYSDAEKKILRHLAGLCGQSMGPLSTEGNRKHDDKDTEPRLDGKSYQASQCQSLSRQYTTETKRQLYNIKITMIISV